MHHRSTPCVLPPVVCCVLWAQEAEKNKGVILEAVKGAPEPVREIAETAVAAHSQEALRKGAVIHDFCLGITFGTPSACRNLHVPDWAGPTRAGLCRQCSIVHCTAITGEWEKCPVALADAFLLSG